VNEHYGRRDLGEQILAAVRAEGKDPERLTADDLAPATEFHFGGKEATLALARLAGLRAGTCVLDVGGGLGGAARTLASELGCQVTVLDLTEEYCRVGELLTARSGLSGQVSFQHGDALDMPFGDGSFDVVWTQHSSMNIADKDRLYTGIHRVVRRGGGLAMQEIMAGTAAPIYFPVPWARHQGISFLSPSAATRALLADKGFKEITWVDMSAPLLEGSRQWLAAIADAGPPPLGVHLLLGDDFAAMSRNQVRNLEEGRISVIRGVFERS
jgi:SAM-dependent methyltransferase